MPKKEEVRSIGDNSISKDRLKSFVSRIEKLNADRDTVTEDIRDVFSEAKGVGLDVKILRQLIRLRKMEESKRREQEELLELYKAAVGLS